MHPSDSRQAVVVAVVAAFNPDASILDHVSNIQAQAQKTIVVDDGSTKVPESLWPALEKLGAVVLRQPGNFGIAAALNRGARLAVEELDADFVLTLDQDSRLRLGYVDAALAAADSATRSGLRVGLIAPEAYGDRIGPTIGKASGFDLAFDPMQSGSLVPVGVYRSIGYYEEALIIDGVDSEFTARLREHCYQPLIGQGCVLEHKLGERSEARFFGRTVKYNYHSPLRVYYISRNGAIIVKRHLRDQPGWTVRRTKEELKAHTMRLAFSPGKAKILRAMAVGLADGLRGRTGKIPVSLVSKIAPRG